MSKPAGASGSSVASVGEFLLIARETANKQKELPKEIVGIGDDCAVLPLRWLTEDAAASLVVTTDSLVENKDFRLSYSRAVDLGWKLAAINLSDIAAMGAEPRACFLNLQIPASTPVAFVDDFYKGLYSCLETFGVYLLGGDTSSAGEISLALTVLGKTGAKPLLRAAASPGETLWVSGQLGRASFALNILENNIQNLNEFPSELIQECYSAFFTPRPKISLGTALSNENLASAAIDISDGLIQDALQVAAASKVGIEIDFASIPTPIEINQKKYALFGGEDFELLFTAAPKNSAKLSQLQNVTPIGRVMSLEESGNELLLIKDKDGRSLPWKEFLMHHNLEIRSGFQHF